MNLYGAIFFALTFPIPFCTFAQNPQKAQMQYIATFEAGQPGAGVYKLYDQSDDVICYVLMPETASRKQVDGKWVYEANALGSLSCLKANSSEKSTIKK